VKQKKLVAIAAAFFPKERLSRFSLLILEHDDVECHRRIVGVEFVLVGKETRIVGRNLIDVEPGAVNVARGKRATFR
jgi:hypothetical protein